MEALRREAHRLEADLEVSATKTARFSSISGDGTEPNREPPAALLMGGAASIYRPRSLSKTGDEHCCCCEDCGIVQR